MRTTTLAAIAAVLAALAPAGAAAAPILEQSTLGLEGAKRVAAAAVAYASAHGAPGAAIAIVDAGGHALYLERLDGTFPAGADISVGKARTAVMFKRATRGLEEIINKGRTAMVDVAAVTWFTPLQGGVPIVVDGKVVGAIGVSGAASAQQDEEVALAGAAALTTRQAGNASVGDVTHVAKGVVDAAFEIGDTGGTLVEAPAYRVNASRRDGPGQAEIHTEDTDIFYVLSGSATVVTGGDLVEPRQVAPAELRGLGIRGGSEQRIGAGDVLTIPRGVPHWFKSVNTPLKYYVVKSTETN